MIQSLLVIDDEPNIIFSITEVLSSEKLRVKSATCARDGIACVRGEKPDVVILDLRLPDLSGLDAFDEIRRIDARVPVIMITAYSTTEAAIDAMRRGVFEYLVKPVNFKRLRDVVGRALEVSRLSRTPTVLEPIDDATSADLIVGQSPAMQEVYKAIGRTAPHDATVLITGESGTGKELVARAIYHYSRRNLMPFLAINCAALPETLLESELFGHERGAFTGADQRRVGKFEQVNGGTIFLDEVGDMSPATQAKALRLLQEQQFERIGGNVPIQTDVRVIAATNKDLAKEVEKGTFRIDLYYRLNGFTIRLPPLRERREDIPALTDHFLRVFNTELETSVLSATPETIRVLMEHDWPGNIRELQSAIRYAVVHATGNIITPDCLPGSCLGRSCCAPTVAATTPADTSAFDFVRFVRRLLAENQTDIYDAVCAQLDRIVLAEVMAACHGSQQQAAERLGIARATLRNKLRALGMAEDARGAAHGTAERLA
jgi:two-component system nitrogen regulation response regulator GlnG